MYKTGLFHYPETNLRSVVMTGGYFGSFLVDERRGVLCGTDEVVSPRRVKVEVGSQGVLMCATQDRGSQGRKTSPLYRVPSSVPPPTLVLGPPPSHLALLGLVSDPFGTTVVETVDPCQWDGAFW